MQTKLTFLSLAYKITNFRSDFVDRLGKLPLKLQQLSRTQHFILSSPAAMFVLQAQSAHGEYR